MFKKSHMCGIAFGLSVCAYAVHATEVHDALKDSVYTFCSEVTLTGTFRAAESLGGFKQGEDKPGTLPLRACGNAFLISPTQLITVNHNLVDPTDLIKTHFEAQSRKLKVHNMIFGRSVPVGVVEAEFAYVLYHHTDEPIRMHRGEVSFSWDAPWPDEATVDAFFADGNPDFVLQSLPDSRGRIVGRDPTVDLVVFELGQPVQRDAYFMLGNTEWYPGQSTVSYLLDPPLGVRTKATATVSLRGTLDGLEGVKWLKENQLDPGMPLYRFKTNSLVRGGASGQPTVNPETGELVAVTVGAPSQQTSLPVLDMQYICGTERSLSRHCWYTGIPVSVVLDFLAEHL